MINRQGLSGVIKNASNPSANSQNSLSSNLIIKARVLDVILDEFHPKFIDQNEWLGIGSVYYQIVGSTEKPTTPAKPYFPFIKNYPLVNEIIFLIQLPDNEIGSSPNSTSYYYFSPINIFNSPHQNAYPGISPNGNTNLSNIYTQNNVPFQTVISNGAKLNPEYLTNQEKFIEKNNIYPLLPFNGDITLEGRFGNSLRFGNTLKSRSSQQNSWSENGNSGDPITIIRNGQPKDLTEGGIPITEDINNDLSSIWMTSYQKIPIGWDNKFTSFNSSTKPKLLSQYIKPQTIINSSRIVINANSSDILLSSNESTSISSKYLNINSNNFYVDGEQVKLGSKNATEPLLLGDTFLTIFDQLLQSLENLSSVLKQDQIYPGGVATPNALLNTVSSNMNQIIKSLRNELDKAKSKVSKTI